MGKIKEIIEIEKQNMPDYQFNFLYHRVMPGFIFVLGGAIVVLGLGIGLYFITNFQNGILSYVCVFFCCRKIHITNEEKM